MNNEQMYKELVKQYFSGTPRLFGEAYQTYDGNYVVYVCTNKDNEFCVIYNNWQELFANQVLGEAEEDIFDIGSNAMPFTHDQWEFIINQQPVLTRALARCSLV